MAEYIEREALQAFPIRANCYDKEHGNEHFINGIETVMEYAEGLPAADVAPVVHGRWVHDGSRFKSGVDWCHCSECGKSDNFCAHTNFCPSCGAKMDGEDNVAAVPVSELKALRDGLYENDLISMEGLRQLNALIATHEGGDDDG